MDQLLKNKRSFSSFIGLLLFSLTTVLLYTRCSGPDTEEIKPSEQTSMTVTEENELHDKALLFFQSSVTTMVSDDIPSNKIDLGKKLFFDNRLSKDGNISCNSCHNMSGYGVDNLSLSPGDTDELGGRNSPTVFYAFLHGMQFWDGRATDVEDQAGGPILNPVEHNIPNEAFLENRLREVEEYQQLFSEVYPDSTEAITFATITDAIGAFERQLAPVSRFDKWMDGDRDALSLDEKRGLTSFIDNGCITCHNGPALGGNMLQKFGLFGNYWDHTKSEIIDKGRFDETGKEQDKYLFKVPGLRNVEMTYPYFHDGSVADLEEAVRIMGKLQINKGIDEKAVKEITTFLKALTADVDEELKGL